MNKTGRNPFDWTRTGIYYNGTKFEFLFTPKSGTRAHFELSSVKKDINALLILEILSISSTPLSQYKRIFSYAN